MKKQEKEMKKNRVIKNNLFAVRFLFSMNKKAVLCTALNSAIGYALWVYYSAFFVRFVINSITEEKPFFIIATSILTIGFVTMLLTAYETYYSNVLIPVVNAKGYQKLYQSLYKKAENVELACYEDHNFYNKYTMAIDKAWDKLLQTMNSISKIVFGSLAGIVSFITMYSIDKFTLVFILAPFMGNFLFGTWLNKIDYKRYQEMVPYNRRTDYVNRVMYMSEYSKEIRLSNIYRLLKRMYQQAIGGLVSFAGKYAKKTIPLGIGQFYFSYTIIFEGVLLYGAYKAMVVKSLQLADFAVLASIMVTASWVWLGVMNAVLDCNRNGLYIENLRGFIDYKEKLPEDYEGEHPEREINSIEFCNVSFSYQGGKEILHNLSFRIEKNSSSAFVGHNGAGKTTIMKLLFRLYDPTKGEILLNGKNIKEYNLKEYRDLFAVAFQDYKIMSDTVRYNVLMGRKVENEDEVITSALKRSGIYDKIMTFPNKFDTILTREFDNNGENLSGGEYQKLMVARAFAYETPVKVFDEPSSALDPIAEYELFSNILKEGTNHTMIFISHRLSSVKNADMVYMLEKGEIVERGTHNELLEKKGKYAKMYEMQARNYGADDSIRFVNKEETSTDKNVDAFCKGGEIFE